MFQFFRTALIVSLFGMGGCQSLPSSIPNPILEVRLEASDPRLRSAAIKALKLKNIKVSTAETIPLLAINETITQSIYSLSADGSVGAYRITYLLHYRFQDLMDTLKYEDVVDHDENNYRITTTRQQQLTQAIRNSTLDEMAYILSIQ